MGVLAAKARKTVLLTGTLGGRLRRRPVLPPLFRILTQRMIEDGYRPNARGSMAPAAMSFMRDHGVLKDIYTERDGDSHKTAGQEALSTHGEGSGFGPKGIHRFVLPFTVFLKLMDIGGNVLPDYQEEFVDVPMAPEQASAYQRLAATLTAELRQALARRDTTLLGVVLNVLLAGRTAVSDRRSSSIREPGTPWPSCQRSSATSS